MNLIIYCVSILLIYFRKRTDVDLRLQVREGPEIVTIIAERGGTAVVTGSTVEVEAVKRDAAEAMKGGKLAEVEVETEEGVEVGTEGEAEVMKGEIGIEAVGGIGEAVKARMQGATVEVGVGVQGEQRY